MPKDSDWGFLFYFDMIIITHMPIFNSSRHVTNTRPASVGNVWIDSAQITRFEISADGKRKILAGMVRGWAVGPEPLAAIEIILGDTRIASARIGLYRPDLAEVFPTVPHAEYAGFEAELTEGELPEGPCQIILLAVSTSRKAFVKRHTITVMDNPKGVGVMAIRSHIEKCEIDTSGLLCISGWVLAQVPIVSIQLMSNGAKIAGTLPNLSRPDVADRFPNYPNAERSGFMIAADIQDKTDNLKSPLTIEIITRDGSVRRVVATPQRVRHVTMPAMAPTPLLALNAAVQPVSESMAGRAVFDSSSVPEITFQCDFLTLDTEGKLQAAGWLLVSRKVRRVCVIHDGERFGSAVTGKPRPDVAKAYPGIAGSMQAGFELMTQLPGPFSTLLKIGLVVELENDIEQSFEFNVEPVIPGTLLETSERSGDAVLMAVDGMQIEAGHAKRTINGPFHLMGWAVARAGISRVEVFLDDALLGQAYHGMRREDVGLAFPDHRNSLLSGFAFAVPSRFLTTGRSRLRAVAFDEAGQSAELTFTVDIDISEGSGTLNKLRRKMPWAEAQTGLQIMAAQGPFPVCDILLRLNARRNLKERALASLESLSRQIWPEWRLWLVPCEGVDIDGVLATLTVARPEDAARFARLEDMPAFNEDPGFVTVLNAGDVLAVDGLLAVLLAAQAGDELLYADDRRPEPMAPARMAAYRKPGWSPDLLLSQNYIGRAWIARHSLLAAAGLSPADLALAGDYAAILRLTEAAGAAAIRHQPTIMLESAGGRETAIVERRSLTTHLRDKGLAARVLPGPAPFLHRVARKPVKPSTVSIIIPSIGAKDHIIRCLESIRRYQGAIPIEIVVVDNLRRRGLSVQGKAWKKWFRSNADTVVEVDEPFNWSRLNNLGAAAAKGDYLLFLNDDIEVLSPDWLEVLSTEAARPEVGVVGAQLLYPNGKVQHAGMFMSRAEPGNFRHAFRFADAADPGYFGLALSQRNLLCVTGACMMIRRDVFDTVSGFDEAHSVVNNDVDFCLRLHRSGRLVVFTPNARLTHYELASRANLKDNFDRSGFLATWGDLCLAGDPYLNPAISSEADDYAPEEEPLREVYAGHPLGARDAVRRILAVKLDHIGDLVTALPAFRRLKALFPQAHLSALVGRSAMSIAAMEPAIDTLIPFEFFDARSGLGRKKLTKADYAALEADLKARNFDLAVDLRKLGDTRHILQLSGAPLLAGFDHNRDFPWLDIALEWESDTLQANKRNHVATDLLNLVDAAGTAFTTDRRTISMESAALPPISEALRREFADLFEHPYVIIHPAAGTPLRQWSPEKFSRLIDLLVDEDDMRVALIGGPDEREIADRVLAAVRRSDRVFNLVGRSKLSEVPRIMAQSVLFVGNNSGPSHIASGLGVPTVAVHSALVSSEEWGPLGPSAVALRRDMSCAPCYIVSVDQCHRAMGCLHGISPIAVHQVCRRYLALRRLPSHG